MDAALPTISKDESAKEIKTHQRAWLKSAGQMAGFMFLAGDLAFMAYAKKANAGRPDVLRMFRGAAYIAGSAILITQTGANEAVGIKQEHDTFLSQAQITPRENKQLLDVVKNEIQTHPWEVANLLFMSGAAMHSVAALRQHKTFEAAASLGTIASLLISTCVNEVGEKPFIRAGSAMDQLGQHFSHSYQQLKKALPICSVLFELTDIVADRVQHHPLSVGAATGMLANTFYGLEALKGEKPSAPLALMSGLYIGGNAISMMSSKIVERSKDDDAYLDHMHTYLSHDRNAAFTR